jgi:hypothetical protein
MDSINPIEVRMASEMVLTQQGCHLAQNMPPLACFVPRLPGQVAQRLGCLTSVIQLYFDMPADRVKDYLVSQELWNFTSENEQNILSLPEIEIDLLKSISWQIEAAWAMLWALGKAQEFSFDQRAPTDLFRSLPNIWQDEAWLSIKKTTVRSAKEIYQMLDFYYRLHFHCIQAHLLKEKTPYELGVIAERRKAFHWIMHPDTSWDNIDMRFHFAEQKKS